MVNITFVIPSVLNKGGGELRLDMDASSLSAAFTQAAVVLGDDFARRVLEPDGSPRSLINVYINGKNAKFTGGMDAPLDAGDEVYILPAVAGGSQELSRAELDRYSRQVMLPDIGYEGQLKLRNARVCVVGTGGLGNPITARLATMGVGTLRIVDRDVIETSNLHRQTMFTPDDVGQIKVEVAAKKLRKMNPDCEVQPLAVSVNEFSAGEVIDGCDVVIDALDSVDARYALNKACVSMGTPFVTGAAVGVSGQVFTVMPKQGACYHCMFPDLDEDEMPTCGVEGVHPSILSIVGGFEVFEAVRVIMGKSPALSNRIMHIDMGDDIAISHTRTFRAEECPVCGITQSPVTTKEDLIIEELCGRNGGKRTFSLTPVNNIAINMKQLAERAKEHNLQMENLGELGISLRNDAIYVNLLQRGSAVVVGVSDQDDAIALYRSLLKYY